MKDLNELTRRFLMGESIERNTQYHIGTVIRALKGMNTRSMTIENQNRLDEAKSHIMDIQRKNRATQNKIKMLEEQVQVLRENLNENKEGNNEQ